MRSNQIDNYPAWFVRRAVLPRLFRMGTLQHHKPWQRIRNRNFEQGGSISEMGYRDDSPYQNSPFLDISTPEGLIDMSQTGKALFAQDETGFSKVLPPYSGMHKFRGKTVREEPLLQRGGYSKQQLYNFLFEDDEESHESTEKSDNPTAPSERELTLQQQNENQSRQLKQLQSQQQYNLALQIANGDFQSSVPNQSSNNQYSSQNFSLQLPKSKGINLENIDPKVTAATNELLAKFPKLRITSGRRSWGDKDAHPKGRAIDLAGEGMEEAFEYYKKVIVPKYGFNPALDLNHGTGKHIHAGFYRTGGQYRPKY